MRQSGDDGAAGAVDWQAVRRLYEAGEVPISAILARFGISKYELTGARLAGGWRTRPQVAEPGPEQGRGAVHMPTLKRRLMHVIDEHFTARAAQAAAGEVVTLTGAELALLAAMMREWKGGEAMKRHRKHQAAGTGRRPIPDRPAVGGGFATPEEARAADEAFMRAELKRRLEVLAAALPRGEGAPAGEDDGGAA